jgi:hypothetical protein
MKRTLPLLLFLVIAASANAASSVPRTAPEAADYTVMAGKVSIKTYGEHMIGIAASDRGDGEWMHLFRLWSDESFAPLSVQLDEASIEFRGSEVVVMSGDPRAFYVFGTPESRFTAPRAPAGFSGVHYLGYGLNHEIRAVAAPVKAGRIKTAECDDPLLCPFEDDPGFGGGGGGGGTSCTAGGVGSTSCTVSSGGNSCTASCSAGYYACCNFGPLSCRCIRN